MIRDAKFYRGDAKRQLHLEIDLLQGIHHLQPLPILSKAGIITEEGMQLISFADKFSLSQQKDLADECRKTRVVCCVIGTVSATYIPATRRSIYV